MKILKRQTQNYILFWCKQSFVAARPFWNLDFSWNLVFIKWYSGKKLSGSQSVQNRLEMILEQKKKKFVRLAKNLKMMLERGLRLGLFWKSKKYVILAFCQREDGLNLEWIGAGCQICQKTTSFGFFLSWK